MRGRIGVCSWSLGARSTDELVERVRETGLRYVHLALDPLRKDRDSGDATIGALTDAGIQVPAGMMAFRGEDYSSLESIRRTGGVALDANWAANLEAARENAAAAARHRIPLVTFHAGFIPHERGRQRETMLERLRAMTDSFEDQGVRVAFETGQETAPTLMEALQDLKRATVGVNFDPANMILYGMGDPVEAVRQLAPRVAQVHIKDATPTAVVGTWGREVATGTGAVDWPAFFGVLRDERVECDFMIEREAGGTRVPDILAARKIVERHLG